MLVWDLLVVLLLILLNAFFAMSEMAVVSSRRSRLHHMAEQGRRGARAALELIDDPSRFLSAVQVGITLIGVVAGAFSGATIGERLADTLRSVDIIAPYADAIGIGTVVVAITYLSLIVGELVPKRIALSGPERLAVRVAPVMRAVAEFGTPVVWLLGVSTDAVLRLLGVRQAAAHKVSHEEIRTLVAEGMKSGVLEAVEKDMIERVLRLAARDVRAIMTPRPDVVFLSTADDVETLRRKMNESGFSRYPVSRDGIDDVVGVVQTKDLLHRSLGGHPPDLQECVSDPLVVHEGMAVLRLLEMFKQTPLHMALVVDEYGGLEGIVTLTDIMEAVAGDIPDVSRDEEPMSVRRADGSWLLDGMMPIDEVEHVTGLKGMLGEHDFATLAGFVLAHLKHVPAIGDTFDWQGARFEVVDMDGRRVDRVLLVPPSRSGEHP